MKHKYVGIKNPELGFKFHKKNSKVPHIKGHKLKIKPSTSAASRLILNVCCFEMQIILHISGSKGDQTALNEQFLSY